MTHLRHIASNGWVLVLTAALPVLVATPAATSTSVTSAAVATHGTPATSASATSTTPATRATTAAAAQDGVVRRVVEPPPPNGAAIFKMWCASCHGMTAQGNGALAPMLKRVPPDLTLIATRNGGTFPTARIRRIVDGREVESHGDPEMPIWGTAFKSTVDGYTEASVRARIDAVVAYLESIQKRNAH